MSSLSASSRSQRRATPDTACAKYLVYSSAFLFICGGLILISDSFAERAASHHTYHDYKTLNTTVLVDIWEQRRNHAGLRVLGQFIFCAAYLCMVPAITVLVDGVSVGAKNSSATRLLLPCFGITAFTIVLSLLTSAGTLSVADWVSTFAAFKPEAANQHLHDGGWGPYQSLEVSYRVQTGQSLWLVVFDELALSVFFGLVGWFTLKSPPLKRVVHRCHPWLSFAISIFLHLTFWFGILKFVNWRVFAMLSGVTGILANLILVPIWLVSLGRHLHVLQVVGAYNGLLDDQYSTGGSHEMGTTSSNGGGAGGSGGGATTPTSPSSSDLGERI